MGGSNDALSDSAKAQGFHAATFVEVAGVEPASLGLLTSLLRAQLGLISPFRSSNEANGFFYLSFP